jgi:hypothetical protein
MDLHAEQRTDRLLSELSARYDLKAGFLQKLRPLAHSILHERFDEERRLSLLEQLAETCERDRILRVESDRAHTAVKDFVARLKNLLYVLEEKRRRLEGR